MEVGSPHHASSNGLTPGAQGGADAWLHRAAVTSEVRPPGLQPLRIIAKRSLEVKITFIGGVPHVFIDPHASFDDFSVWGVWLLTCDARSCGMRLALYCTQSKSKLMP